MLCTFIAHPMILYVSSSFIMCCILCPNQNLRNWRISKIYTTQYSENSPILKILIQNFLLLHKPLHPHNPPLAPHLHEVQPRRQIPRIEQLSRGARFGALLQ